MKRISYLLLCFSSWPAYASNSLTLPWDEFKALYTEKLQQEYAHANDPEPIENTYSLSSASYDMTITEDQAVVTLRLKGEFIDGISTRIPLLSSDIVITEIEAIQGAELISTEQGYQLWLDQPQTFELSLRFLSLIKKNKHGHFIEFKTPHAIQNNLTIQHTTDHDYSIVNGIQTRDDQFFSPQGNH